jgi:hypothetical protein
MKKKKEKLGKMVLSFFPKEKETAQKINMMGL